jgi:endonuclease/exonuclease/phosphatase (EEP) superfamily protein YafD
VHFSPGDIFGELHLRETLFFAKKNRIKPIIVGDFNITDKNLVDQIMGEDYKSSASIKNYVSHPETGRTIDYAVIPKDYNFKSVICDGDGLSDHKALIVEI